MIKFNIVSVVSDYKKNFYEGETRRSYSTEEEARKHLPTVEDIKNKMKKELEQGARYSDSTAFEYVLEKEDDEDIYYETPEELARNTVYFSELKKEEQED